MYWQFIKPYRQIHRIRISGLATWDFDTDKGHLYGNADHVIFLFIVVNYIFTQLWLCGNWPFGQISWWHIKHVPDHYTCDQSTCIKSNFESLSTVYKSINSLSSRENKKTFSNKSVRYQIRRKICIEAVHGKAERAVAHLRKPLQVHGSALPIATALNGKISESVVSNSDRCTCQTFEIGKETKSLMPSIGGQCSLQCRCFTHDWCCVLFWHFHFPTPCHR